MRYAAFLVSFLLLVSAGLNGIPALAHTPSSSTLELVGDVPSPTDEAINFIDAMHVLAHKPSELFFSTENQGASCGGGTPASVWKMTLNPHTGKKVSVARIQNLTEIQSTRADLFESSAGTLFTGGGWSGYKPAYYSVDRGMTWHTADSGPVHPPNSVFTFSEFKGDVYAGTGYEPFPAEIYRWLGNGLWEKVLEITSSYRTVINAMAVYDHELFVGSWVYGG